MLVLKLTDCITNIELRSKTGILEVEKNYEIILVRADRIRIMNPDKWTKVITTVVDTNRRSST